MGSHLELLLYPGDFFNHLKPLLQSLEKNLIESINLSANRSEFFLILIQWSSLSSGSSPALV